MDSIVGEAKVKETLGERMVLKAKSEYQICLAQKDTYFKYL